MTAQHPKYKAGGFKTMAEIIHYNDDWADLMTKCGRNKDYTHSMVVTMNKKKVTCKHCLGQLKIGDFS